MTYEGQIGVCDDEASSADINDMHQQYRDLQRRFPAASPAANPLTLGRVLTYFILIEACQAGREADKGKRLLTVHAVLQIGCWGKVSR